MPNRSSSTASPLLLLLLLAVMPGCDLVDLDPVKTVLETLGWELRRTEQDLVVESSAWRDSFDGAVGKLPKELRAAISTDFEQSIQTVIGYAGTTVLGIVDSIPRRIEYELQKAKAIATGKPIPPKVPVVLLVTPDAVDLNADRDTRRRIRIQGYDFEDASLLHASLIGGAATQDISNTLARQSNYSLVVDLSRLDDGVLGSQRQLEVVFVPKAGTQIELTKIAIEKYEPPPAPKPRYVRVTAPKITYVPPHTEIPGYKLGDADFDANGPKVTISVFYKMTEDKFTAKVYMQAWEWNVKENKAKDNYTAAEGTSKEYIVYEPPPGWKIANALGQLQWEKVVEYIDTNHENDVFDNDLGHFVCVGDTGDDEAGTRTKVDVEFGYAHTLELAPR